MATDDESAALLAALRSQRAHVLGTLDGLGDADLRRPVLPSGWSCLGLVNHLTLDVERFWFRAVVAGETVDLPSGDGGWQVGADTPARAVLDAYRDEAGARRRRDRRHTAGRGTPLVARGPVRRHPPQGPPADGAARADRDRLPRRPPGRRPRAARRPYLGLRCGPAGRAWVTSPTDLSDPGLWCAATWSGVRPGDQLVVDGLVRGAASRWTGRWSPGDGRCCCCGSSPRPPPTASA